MGHAYNESFGAFRKRKINYCNKLFATWDFNITDNKSSELRKSYNKTNFQVSREYKNNFWSSAGLSGLESIIIIYTVNVQL